MFLPNKNSLTARVVLLGTVATLLSTLVVAWAGLWLFERSLDTQLDNHLTAHTDILVGAVRVEDGNITIDEANPLLQAIPRHWQIDTNSAHIAKSRLLKDWLPLPNNPSFEPHRLNPDSHLMAIRQAFQLSSNHVVFITFGLEKAIADQYKAALRSDFIDNTYPMLLLILLVLVTIAVIQTVVITTPLRKIGMAVQDVRQGNKRRIEDPQPTEIQVLSDEINGLLDYIDGVLKRHRTFSGNLAHALKTPLSVIRSEVDSPLVHEQIDVMLQVIERNLAKARSAGSSDVLSVQTPIKPMLERICKGFTKVYSMDYQLDCPDAACARMDESDLFEVLGNLIENACKYGESQLVITVDSNGIVIEDDGPGIPEAEYQNVLSRGTRLDTAKSGSGLGLSICKEVMELYGGELRLATSGLGGLKAVLKIAMNFR